MDEFEKLLIKELIDSLSNNPEKWKTSIIGIKRDDGLDLAIGTFEEYANVYVYKPYRYELKDLESRQKIFRIAKKIIELQRVEQDKKEALGSEKKLADFLNLDTRKNKLERLKEISVETTVTQINVGESTDVESKTEQPKVKKSFFDIFKKT